MRRFLILAASALALSFGVAPAQAHHSMAMFDQSKTVSLKGTVKQFQWTNPHCYIQMMVKDAAGKDVEWSLEMGANVYLYNLGWRPSTVQPGDTLTVAVIPLRNGQRGGLLVEAKTADGKTLGGNP